MDEEKREEEPMEIMGFSVPTKRAPLWVRILLMLALLAIVGIGFYLTNEITFERVNNR